jgi:transcription initiation factor TFIIH subunit 4
MRTDCLLPNLFVGSLTRESFLAALELGISAGDVTAFLQQHAHPQVARRVPSVPEVSLAHLSNCMPMAVDTTAPS